MAKISGGPVSHHQRRRLTCTDNLLAWAWRWALLSFWSPPEPGAILMPEEERIGVKAAAANLSRIVNQLKDGETGPVVITNHDKAVARLVAYEDQKTREAEH